MLFWKSIKAQIVIASTACLVVGVVVIAATNYGIARTHAYEGLAMQNRALATGYAQAISEWMQLRQKLVNAAVHDAEPSRALMTLRDTGLFEETSFDFVNPGASSSSTANGSLQPGYQEVLTTKESVVSAPYRDAASGRLVVSFTAPLVSGGGVTSVGAAKASLAGLASKVGAIQPSPKSFAFLVAADGQIIVHPDEGMLLKQVSSMSQQLSMDSLQKTESSTALITAQIQGAQYWVVSVPVAGSAWRLAIALNQSDVMAPIASMLSTSVVVSVVVLLVSGFLLVGFLNQRFVRLHQLRDAMQEVGAAEGDFSRRLDTQGGDELSQIALSFNVFADRMAFMFSKVRESSSSVRFAAEDIASGTSDLQHRTEATAQALDVLSSSMQRLTEVIHTNAQASEQATASVATASRVAEQGGNVVGKAVKTMNSISRASTRIADIIGVIDGIAFQTNILALNAAVEAARAGEQGRGFAVVAAEVGQLAQRSAQAAKEINTLISSSVEGVGHGVQLVHSVGTTIQEIVQAVRDVEQVIATIHQSSAQQAASIHTMGSAVGELEQLAVQNAQLVEQSTNAAAGLRGQSIALTDALGTMEAQ